MTTETVRDETDAAMVSWRPLVVLGTAQFLMVLDSAVMNVSISQLVEDFDTEVTAIQFVITMYALVMAATMITGGKLGDLLGRRRAFRIGLVIYGLGSLVTAASGSVPMLLFGWSLLEGLGAALVLPALAALIGSTYTGRQRTLAYGVLGGLAGAGIAVGPILGGYFTTNLSWRWVFVGEALLVLGMLALSGWLSEAESDEKPSIDVVGAVLSAAGLALIVYSVLQASTWGWLAPRNSPVEPLGYSLFPFVLGAGFFVLWAFVEWQKRRERHGQDPLVRVELFQIPPLRAGLSMLLAQNLILLGVFFAIPLYLQITQGLDALETGIRLLPVSIMMLVFAMSGPVLQRVLSPRQIVRIGLLVLAAASLLLVGTIEPQLDDAWFSIAMGTLGIGMGLLASQLGNVVQSAVEDDARSEVGGLQYTFQNLGSALGTALVGAILLSALATSFLNHVAAEETINDEIKGAVSTQLQAGLPFVSTEEAEAALADSQIPPDQKEILITTYEDAQLEGLRVAILAVAGLSLVALFGTANLPGRSREDP